MSARGLDIDREALPLVAINAAAVRLREQRDELEAVIAEMDRLRERYAKRQAKGLAILKEIARAARLYEDAVLLFARDAVGRAEGESAAAHVERELHVWRASVASFGDPAWRAAMGFPDDASFGVFGNDD